MDGPHVCGGSRRWRNPVPTDIDAAPRTGGVFFACNDWSRAPVFGASSAATAHHQRLYPFNTFREHRSVKLLREQKALATFGELALRAGNLDNILNEACRLVAEALGTDLATVMELQADGLTLVVRAGVGWKAGVVGVVALQASENTSEGLALNTRQPMTSRNIATETRFRFPDFLAENGVQAVANVLIIGGSGRLPFGMLQIDSREPRDFKADDIAFLRSYANLLAAAVDRLRVIEETRDGAERLRLALEAGHLGIWEIDLTRNSTSCSPRYEQIFGYDTPPAQWSYAIFLQHVLPDDRMQVAAAFDHAVENGTDWRFECRIRRANDDGIRWIEMRGGRVGDRIGNLSKPASAAHILGIVIDITDRVRSEERVRQSQRLEAVGRLTAGVAHDFNNVLQSLLGNLELAIDAVPNIPEARTNLELALQAGQRGARLTSHLLSFSRQQVLHPVAVALHPLLLDLSRTLSRTLGADIVVRIDVPSDLPNVLADDAHLDSALLNLALNAREAMRSGGELRIEARVHEAQIVIAVIDTGQGMPPEVLAQACEPFYSTKGAKGSGLGLAMAQGFARQSGGELRIQSMVGQGTRIEIWLPIADRSAMRLVDTPPPTRQQGGGKVLLVDDDAEVGRVTSIFLRKAGYDVVMFASGAAALVGLQADPDFTVLVSDYAMPEMNGAELVARAWAVRPDLPALLITGYNSSDKQNHLPPNVAVLGKPFSRQGLLHAVSAVVRDHVDKTAPPGQT